MTSTRPGFRFVLVVVVVLQAIMALVLAVAMGGASSGILSLRGGL